MRGATARWRPANTARTGATAKVEIRSPVAASYALRSKTPPDAVIDTYASAGSAPGANVSVAFPAERTPPWAARISTDPAGGPRADQESVAGALLSRSVAVASRDPAAAAPSSRAAPSAAVAPADPDPLPPGAAPAPFGAEPGGSSGAGASVPATSPPVRPVPASIVVPAAPGAGAVVPPAAGTAEPAGAEALGTALPGGASASGGSPAGPRSACGAAVAGAPAVRPFAPRVAVPEEMPPFAPELRPVAEPDDSRVGGALPAEADEAAFKLSTRSGGPRASAGIAAASRILPAAPDSGSAACSGGGSLPPAAAIAGLCSGSPVELETTVAVRLAPLSASGAPGASAGPAAVGASTSRPRSDCVVSPVRPTAIAGASSASAEPAGPAGAIGSSSPSSASVTAPAEPISVAAVTSSRSGVTGGGGGATATGAATAGA